ncbi:HEAT repeat domain-containing protein, partial [Streptomyces sp. NPDC002476]|uniref:HEAT repeat domain-containing protein n=1 Tax=Streptomyces sp. NPDC002476 TaxID=3364648 RepID=UPI0036882AED
MEFLTDASEDPGGDLVHMLNDPEPDVRGRAMNLLLRREPVPRIVKDLLASPDENLRASVIDAIDNRSTKRLLKDLRPSLRAPAPRVRMAALDALARLGALADGELGDALGDQEDSVRTSALEIVLRENRSIADIRLTDFLTAPNPRTRMLALRALARCPDPGACEWVERLLTDPVAYVRRLAMRTVASMECNGTEEALSRIAGNAEHEDDRYEALGALLSLDADGIPAVLSHALRDRSAKVRTLASGAARRCGADVPWALLSETVLADPSPGARSAAAESLAGGHDEARESLARALLLDPDRAVRLTAARSLASFGSAAVPHLIHALEDDDARVRRTAVIALRSSTAPEAVLALTALGGVERDEEVRTELVDFLTGSARSDGWGSRDRQAARPLFDPGAQSRASTSWLTDLARYPTSTGVIFYATGYVRAIADASAGALALYAYRVQPDGVAHPDGPDRHSGLAQRDGLLHVFLPQRPDLHTAFSVTEEEFTDAYGVSR